MAASMVTQQQKIESLTERIIRLETALEIAMSRSSAAAKPARRLTHKE
jgi:hypothetical protein